MSILDGLRRLTARVVAGLRRAVHAVRGWAASMTDVARRAAGRHHHRFAADPTYTRAVATAVSELAVTLLPSPNVATAVAILLTGWASPDPAPAHQPGARPTTVYDEEPYEPYPVTRRSSSPSTSSPWDRYNT